MPIPQNPKIFIGINTLSTINSMVYSNHLEFFTQLGREYPRGQVSLFTPRRFSIDTMRNMAAKLAVENDYDYLLFIDDDILLEATALKQLIDRDKDIIAGLTMIRGYPYRPMMFRFSSEGSLGIFEEYEEASDESGLVQVDAVGCSFTLIKVDVIRKMSPPYFVTGAMNTEDVYFCLKALQVGAEIFVDTLVPTGHLLDPQILTPRNAKKLKEIAEETDPTLLPKPVDRGEEYFERNGITLGDPDVETV